jgi:thioredoxin 2
MLQTCSACGAKNRIPASRLHEIAKCGKCKAALPAQRAPIEVPDQKTFDEIILNARVPVLVDFWASWCGPCRMVAPEVQKVAEQLAGQALVVKVNTEYLPELAARYHEQGIPNFVVIDFGQVVRQQAGAMRAADLAKLVPVGQRAA